MSGLLRSLLLFNKTTRHSQMGFVLPTTVLLLLIVALTAGALSFRSFSRTQSVIAQKEQEVIVGAATPAVDRAKAKIEYLFSQDSRFPGGLPTSNKLQAMMLNIANNEANGSNNAPLPGTPAGRSDQDVPPYTLPDETRLDINDDGNLDNAWSFLSDIDGDGTARADEVIVYSVLMDDAQDAPGDPTATPPIPPQPKDVDDEVDQTKANALVTRNAPIDTDSAGNACPTFGSVAADTGQRDSNSLGWEKLDNLSLLKNFQIDVFVLNDNPVNRTVSALEFQQVRQADKGNKWGAWFKTDLELFPTTADDFIWNGAMHTEGSVFLGNAPQVKLISAYASCLYPDVTASEITLADKGSFEGQFVSGRLSGGYGGDPRVDWKTGATHGSAVINAAGDSISQATPGNIGDIALNTIQLFTSDTSVHVGNSWERRDDWLSSPLVQNGRVLNKNESTPFLDDTYRADNRYGPKAAYSDNFKLKDVNNGGGVPIGTEINSSETGLVGEDGLDGYWERQAIKEGWRIIGGQRLELGNRTVWRGDGFDTAPSTINGQKENPRLGLDPLYNQALSFKPSSTATNKSVRLHRLSLNDNLAAVQSMAVYHGSSNDGGDFPMMCLSMTSHPGTPTTIRRSTSFNDFTGIFTGSSSAATVLDADFFNGFGTNGWEYEPPLGSNESSFRTAYDDASSVAGSALRKALKNLAYFAGDPEGGAPSFTPVQDISGGNMHPYPMQTMWGDFSHLRRLIDRGDLTPTSGAYDSLSPADKSYVHTAACTLGMLAHNIRTAERFQPTEAELNQLADAIGALNIPNVGDTLTDFNNIRDSQRKSGDVPYTTAVLPTAPHAYLGMLQTQADQSGNSNDREIAQLARMFHLKYQIQRDRKHGFRTSAVPYVFLHDSQYTLTSDTDAGNSYRFKADLVSRNWQKVPDDGTSRTVLLGEDYDNATINYFGLGAPTNSTEELRFLRLAALAGGIDTPTGRPNSRNAGQPSFPSLFYLFPVADHSHAGPLTSPQPSAEPYIADAYISGQNNSYELIDDSGLSGIEILPKNNNDVSTANDWISPYISTNVSNRSNQIYVNSPTTPNRAVLLLDKGFMDGRELLSSRAIDVDIDLATTENIGDSASTTWIAPNTATTTGGIVYAFREDAKREDAIVRPLNGTSPTSMWSNCLADITADNCRMQFDFDNLFDPPLRRENGNENNYISPKPVDYFADPFRRPYGFRLSNGETLNRPSDVIAGLSFITDNVVFIKGDFNLHKEVSPGTSFLEEFKNPGAASLVFYGRNTAEAKFADPEEDSWRPVEIVGDAVGIVSNAFVDGAISDALMLPRGPNRGDGVSSYQNYLRPKGNSAPANKTLPVSIKNLSIFRENPYDGFALPDPSNTYADDSRYIGTNQNSNSGDAIASPIKIPWNGNFRGETSSISGDLITFETGNMDDWRRRDRIRAIETTVNALLISGVVPSRPGQSNGGLHNFPRLLEHWGPSTNSGSDSIPLNISGGFFQLSFSTSATAPWEQEPNMWEPKANAPSTANASAFLTYYGAPKRVWGYDVALQFAPAGPVSNRFVTIGSPRSEYYQEVPATDPYIRNLQCAVGDLDRNGSMEAVIASPTVDCS